MLIRYGGLRAIHQKLGRPIIMRPGLHRSYVVKTLDAMGAGIGELAT